MQPQNWTALNTVAFTPLAFQDFVPSNISKSGSSNIQHYFGTIQWGCQQKALVLLEQFKQASGKNCVHVILQRTSSVWVVFFFSPQGLNMKWQKDSAKGRMEIVFWSWVRMTEGFIWPSLFSLSLPFVKRTMIPSETWANYKGLCHRTNGDSTKS